jgi:hypothetical protein
MQPYLFKSRRDDHTEQQGHVQMRQIMTQEVDKVYHV